MTTRYNFVGYGVDSDAIGLQPGLQRHYRLGRNYKPNLQFSTGFFSLSVAIRPMPVALARATDQWGIAFPAGNLWVVYNVAIPLAPAATIDQSWLDYWDAQLQLGLLWSVPGVLPAGYTQRNANDWNYGLFHGFNPGSTYYDGAVDTNGPAPYVYWLPTRFSYGRVQSDGGMGAPWTGDDQTGRAMDQCTGYRAVQILASYNNNSINNSSWGGSFTVKISHNANGSAVSPIDSLGDTVDSTTTFTLASFTGSGSGGFGQFTSYTTAYVNSGTALATLGVYNTAFAVQVDYSGVTGIPDAFNTSSVNISLRNSPRLDVPLPFTCTNCPNIIAPGGLVT